MSSTFVEIVTPAGVGVLSDDLLVDIKRQLNRSVQNQSTIAGRSSESVSTRKVPTAVAQPTGTNGTGETLITWVEPTDGTCPTHYIVNVCLKSDNSTLATVACAAGNVKVCVSKLATNTVFAVVTPANEVGSGAVSTASADITIA